MLLFSLKRRYRVPARSVRFFALIGFVLCFHHAALSAAGDESAESRRRIQWDQLAEMPAPAGLGGVQLGAHRGVLIAAGGSIADETRDDGGRVWRDEILALTSPTGAWQSVGRLPKPVAHGATVSTDQGVVIIGGVRGGQPVADVVRVSWDAQAKACRCEPLPSLPRPATSVAAGRIGATLFVAAVTDAGEEESPDGAGNYFWSIDLSRLTGDGTNSSWRELPPCPGPLRGRPVVSVQALGSGEEQFFLFGGHTSTSAADGSMYSDAAASLNVPHDAYRFDPRDQQWVQLGALPTSPRSDESNPSPGAVTPVAATSVGQSHILVFTADDQTANDDQSAAPSPAGQVWAYHTITGTWSPIAAMPAGLAATEAVSWKNDVALSGGPVVHRMSITQDSAEFGLVNYVVLTAYLLAMVAVGFYFSVRMKSTDDFFRGGQRVPFWAAGLSIFATMLSSITFMALPAKAYATDWLYYPAQLTVLPIAVIVIWIVLPFFRRIDATSAYEYLELRFNRPVRLLGSAQFVMFQVGRMAVVMYLPALALATVTPFTVGQCVVLMGILSVIYCTLGGVEAVIWTDAIQTIVLIAGLLLAIVVAVAGADGNVWSAWAAAAEQGKMRLADLDFSGSSIATTALWVVLVGQFFQSLYSYTSDQAVVQRYLTTKDEEGARGAMWTTAAMSVFGSLLFFVLGTALYIYYQEHPGELLPTMKTDAVFPLFIAEKLPPGIAGLVIAGIFAAAQSTISTSMNSTATALVIDFCKPFNMLASDAAYLRLAQLFTALLGVAGTALAYWLTIADVVSMVDQFMTVLGLFGGALCGLFMLGMLTRRANSLGGFLGMLIGAGAVWGAMRFTAVNHFLYAGIGTVTTFVCGYVISWLTPGPRTARPGLTVHG